MSRFSPDRPARDDGVETAMVHAATYAAVAAVSIAGAGAGVLLGRAAISEINPIYYQTLPQSRFFADLSPNRPSSVGWSTEVPADYWTNDLNVSGRPYCVECSADLTETASLEADPPTALATADLAYTDDGTIGREQGVIERYADFPVTREEAVDSDDIAVGDQARASASLDEGAAPVGM